MGNSSPLNLHWIFIFGFGDRFELLEVVFVFAATDAVTAVEVDLKKGCGKGTSNEIISNAVCTFNPNERPVEAAV